MRARWLTTGLLVIAAGGCGGPDRGAEWTRWSRAADRVCAELDRTVAARGGALDLNTAAGIARRAASDIREAITRIERIPSPKGSERRAQQIVDGAAAVRPQLDALARVTRARRPEGISTTVLAIRVRADQFALQARKAGLRSCGRADRGRLASDALLVPAFAAQVTAIDLWLGKRVRRAIGEPSTASAVAASLTRAGVVLRESVEQYRDLQPPEAAQHAYDRYLDSIESAGVAWLRVADDVERRSDELTPQQLRRRATEPAHALTRAGKRLRRALMAAAHATREPPSGAGLEPA